MFDVQAWHLGEGGASEAAVVASIASYYRRATTGAFPMNRLIGLVMLVTVVAATCRALQARPWRWSRIAALGLAAAPIALGALRVFPNAVRLGTGADPPMVQAGLARAILRDHVACFVAIALFTAGEVWSRD